MAMNNTHPCHLVVCDFLTERRYIATQWPNVHSRQWLIIFLMRNHERFSYSTFGKEPYLILQSLGYLFGGLTILRKTCRSWDGICACSVPWARMTSVGRCCVVGFVMNDEIPNICFAWTSIFDRNFWQKVLSERIERSNKRAPTQTGHSGQLFGLCRRLVRWILSPWTVFFARCSPIIFQMARRNLNGRKQSSMRCECDWMYAGEEGRWREALRQSNDDEGGKSKDGE
jgi:hypothetical protein